MYIRRYGKKQLNARVRYAFESKEVRKSNKKSAHKYESGSVFRRIVAPKWSFHGMGTVRHPNFPLPHLDKYRFWQIKKDSWCFCYVFFWFLETKFVFANQILKKYNHRNHRSCGPCGKLVGVDANLVELHCPQYKGSINCPRRVSLNTVSARTEEFVGYLWWTPHGRGIGQAAGLSGRKGAGPE